MPLKRFRFVWLVCLLAAVFPARAAIQFDVWVGYDSVIRDAAWFPVAVEVHNDGASFNGLIEISSSQFSRDPDRVIPIELPTNTRKRLVVPMYASGGRTSGNWDARLLDKGGKVRAERQGLQTRSLSWQGLMIGALPRAYAGMPTLPKLKISQMEMQPAVTRFQAEQFPDSPIALEGLDALYVNSEKIISLPQPQLEALLAWVRGGGHLILAIEQLGDVTSTPWLQQFLPVDVSSVENRDVDASLGAWLRSGMTQDETDETMTGRARGGRRRTSAGSEDFYTSLAQDPAFAGAQMPIAVARVRDGKAIIGTDAAPLAVQTTRGRGRLTALMFSPEREPFKSWTLRPYFWGRLTQIPTVWLTSPDFSNWGAWSMDGVFGALIDSRQVKKLPVEWLLLLLLVYLVVIGPFDQWWLKKINRQMLTWITFPCYVVFFSLLIYFIGYKLRAGETEWNEVQVVDILPRGDKADLRGRAFISVYSSSNARYPLAGEAAHSMVRPEFIDTYGTARETKMRVEQNGNSFKGEVFVPVWTSLLFVNDWFKTADRPLNAAVTPEGGGWSVRIQNPNSRKLTDVRVVVGGNIYEFGPIEAGAEISKQLNPASGTPLEDFVRTKGGAFEAAVNQRRNPLGHDSGRLDNRPETVAAASFYRMLEGQLQANRAIVGPAGFDMSAEVKRGDAVVLAWDPGQIPVKPINQFQPVRMQRDTMLRLVVPVKRNLL